jgi:hypothetical protein
MKIHHKNKNNLYSSQINSIIISIMNNFKIMIKMTQEKIVNNRDVDLIL